MSVLDEIMKYGYTAEEAERLASTVKDCDFGDGKDATIAVAILKYHGWPGDKSPEDPDDEDDFDSEVEQVD